MKFSVLKTIYFVLLIYFVVGWSQNMDKDIKIKTENLFKNALNISLNDLSISYKDLDEKLKLFNETVNTKIQVYSDKKNITAGLQTVWVKIIHAGNEERFSLTVDVAIYKDVVVVTKNINRGSVFSQNGLKMEIQRLNKNLNEYFFSIDQVIGLKAKHSIQKDTPLTKKMIRVLNVRHSGRLVNLFPDNSINAHQKFLCTFNTI